MKRILLATILAFSTSAFADTLKVDTSASTIGWKGFKKLGSSHDGNIKLKSGTVEFKKDALIGGTFVVDMATISNNDLANSPDYQKKLVGHLSNEDFFNVAKFPESTFKITSVTKKGDKFAIKGDLTMIGQTQPVEFDASIKSEKGKATGEGTLKIDRTKFGLKYGSGNFFKELAADKIISDEFELKLNFTAAK